MEAIRPKRIPEIRNNKEELEKSLDVKITILGKTVNIEGAGIEEYEASMVIDAINAGFSAKKALVLKDEDMIFRKINIKDHTQRSNLEEVRARILGSEGKTKRTIETISGGNVVLTDNTIGVIAPSATIEGLVTAVINLIKGSKQSNVYQYLEKMNAYEKESPATLGLKEVKAPVPKDKNKKKIKEKQSE